MKDSHWINIQIYVWDLMCNDYGRTLVQLAQYRIQIYISVSPVLKGVTNLFLTERFKVKAALNEICKNECLLAQNM